MESITVIILHNQVIRLSGSRPGIKNIKCLSYNKSAENIDTGNHLQWIPHAPSPLAPTRHSSLVSYLQHREPVS